MLKRESLYAFMESISDYLMVVDGQECILYMNPLFQQDCSDQASSVNLCYLHHILTASSLNTFRSAMNQAQQGIRGVGIFTSLQIDSVSIPMKVGYTKTESGDVFLFFANKVEGLNRLDGWEKDERIKELSCLYEVAEWIETSSSVDEFFHKLPRYLCHGMLYPEEIVVYSIYQGVEYGQKISSENYLSVKLVIGQQNKGEIRAGYQDINHELLPEEQKLLDEIGRMLNHTLERKELKEKIAQIQQEEADYNRRLQELKAEVASRTQEIDEQKSNLNIVNSYLDRVNRGWEEAKYRLETVFKVIPDEVVLIDKKRKIIMTNRENVEPGTFCYKTFFNRNKPCDDCRLARILKDKTPVMLTMKHNDRYLQVHALPVYNQQQEVDGILEFYRDVTLEKTYDQQLQQADKLASLGQLVSGIGHEINNPNQFIRGNIKIVKQAFEDMLPIIDDFYQKNPDLKIARLNYDFFREHITTLVDDMNHGSERIKGIVEGLRKFARRDEGLLADTVDINTLIEASTRLVHNEVHKHADIKLDLHEGLPTFTGNAQKIEQVLVNLLVNAGQAMRDNVKGLITIRTKANKNKDIIVEVIDNGAGMNQKTMKQIFDPFYTTKRAKGGTGLGLAIAYRIIEEHNGNITVTSKSTVGTKFTICIPTQSNDQMPE